MSLIHTVHKTTRFLVPKFLAVMVTLLSSQPLHIPGLTVFMPAFELMFVYYWSLHAPKLFPAWFALLLGLLHDALSGAPIGISAFSNLLLLGITSSQRKFLIKEPFLVQWGGFALFSSLITVVEWLLLLLVLRGVTVHYFLLLEWLFTCAFYAIAHGLFDKVSQALARGSRYA